MMLCKFGNELDENGCPTCKCKPKPVGVCFYNGQIYKPGEGFGCMLGERHSCQCGEDGNVMCAMPKCLRPPPGCKFEKSNQCCPKCVNAKPCNHGGKVYQPGERFGCKLGKRHSCICGADGRALCAQPDCFWRPGCKAKPGNTDQCCPPMECPKPPSCPAPLIQYCTGPRDSICKCLQPASNCKMACPYGFDSIGGKPVCMCRPRPRCRPNSFPFCENVNGKKRCMCYPPASLCKMACPNGFETVIGMAICKCKPSKE